MKHKVSELEGALLDAAVAMAEGVPGLEFYEGRSWCSVARSDKTTIPIRIDRYSSDWVAGGPIIKRERISLLDNDDTGGWNAMMAGVPLQHDYDSPLIAAMRAYVASRFGEKVELP